VPLYDDQGQYRFRCAGKAEVLARALIHAVSRARDNELFVILADLAELDHDLAPIVKACRVARARHHHVLVIVPWPADVPSPDSPDPSRAKANDDGRARAPKATDLRKKNPRRAAMIGEGRQASLMKSVRESLTRQYHESFRALRRRLSQVGATVMRFNDGDPVRIVLDRLDRLRGMRSRR
jgi:hypothetical protein